MAGGVYLFRGSGLSDVGAMMMEAMKDLAWLPWVLIAGECIGWWVGHRQTLKKCARVSTLPESAQPAWWRKALVDARAEREKEAIK